MKLDKEATKKAGHPVYTSSLKSQPKEKVEKKTKKVEVEEPKEENTEGESITFRDEE